MGPLLVSRLVDGLNLIFSCLEQFASAVKQEDGGKWYLTGTRYPPIQDIVSLTGP